MIEEKQRTRVSSMNIIYKKIVWFFVLASIVLVGVILYFSLAKATIYLNVKSQPAKIDFTAQIKEEVAEDNNFLETSILQGRVLELVMEKTKEFIVSPKEQMTNKYGGLMTVYNDRSTDQTLVKTTQFQSDQGNIFRTQERIVVPAKSSIEVYVLADEESEDYNDDPGKFIIIKLRPETQALIYGKTKEAMSKKSFTTYELSSEDYEKAQAELIVDLKADAMFKFKDLLLDNENLNEKTIFTEVLSEESGEELEEKVDNFEYTVQIKISAIIFDEDELLTLAQNFLNQQLDKGQKLVNYDSASFDYSISNYAEEEKNVTLDVSLSANIIKDSQSEAFDTEKFKDLSQEEIIDYFKLMPAIESVRVKFSPFWVKKAPKMSDHIEIIISNE
ncbi:hypothetical protein K8R66_04775 [bacterium]|nr:hypothetical protein [bacterium]